MTNRNDKITVSGISNNVVRVLLDGEWWATVEWSARRGQWCIEDVEGRCLQHIESIRGQAPSREDAIALATAMIRDGRMPSPEEAHARAQERREIEARERRQAVEQRKREGRSIPLVIEGGRETEQQTTRIWDGKPIRATLCEPKTGGGDDAA